MIEQKYEEHTDRYWTIALSENDIAEFGSHYYAWDILAPAAIVARCHVMYLDREGIPLRFFEKLDGHHDFEMPQKGFVAGNVQTLRNIGLCKHQEQMSSPTITMLRQMYLEKRSVKVITMPVVL